MKLCLVTESYSPRVDGVAISVRTLESGLRSRTADRPDVVVLAPTSREFGRCSTSSRYRWVRTPYDGYPLPLLTLGRLRRFLHQLEPDLVHLETQGVLGVLTMMACSELGIPVVTTFHTDLVGYSGSYRTAPLLGALAASIASASTEVFRRLGMPRTVHEPTTMVRLVIEWICGESAAVIAPSQKMQGVLARDGCIATAVIPTPRQLSATKVSPGGGHTVAQLPNASKYFCYVGRLSREKTISYLFEAFFRAFGHQSDVYLVMAGSGSVRSELQSLARKVGIGPRVRFTGVLSEDEVAALMSDAVALVQPSLTDTQCLAMWEAASLGTPCVIRDPALTGRGSPIEDELTCLVGTSLDTFSGALERLVADPLTRTGLGDRAKERARAERYSLDHFVERHLAIYSRVPQPNGR